jgi:hypothetical protein
MFLSIFQVSVCFSFSKFFNFLFIFHVLQCTFLIFHVFECFPPYSRLLRQIFQIFQFSWHILGPTVCISDFSRFSIFLAIFYFLQCVFLLFNDFQFSCHIPGPTVCISHFSHFSVFLDIFQVLQCVFLIFHDFQFSCHTPCPSLCISVFSRFSMFLTYFTSYSVCFSFSMSFSFFFGILQEIQCAFLVFLILSVSRHISGQKEFQSHFPRFSVFLSYSRSSSVHFSFSAFSVFLAIFHLL